MEGRWYTQGRRQPWVVSKIGKGRDGHDRYLPFVLNSEEIAVILMVLGTLWILRALWTHFGTFGNTLMLAVSVCGSVMALRKFRPEGRTLRQYAAGLIRYACTRPRGRSSAQHYVRRRVYLADRRLDEEIARRLAREELDALEGPPS